MSGRREEKDRNGSSGLIVLQCYEEEDQLMSGQINKEEKKSHRNKKSCNVKIKRVNSGQDRSGQVRPTKNRNAKKRNFSSGQVRLAR